MENYKDFGPQLFRMSISHCPAKRLGVPEEVCNCTKTQLLQGRSFIKQKKALLYFINEMFWSCHCVYDQISSAVCFLLSPAASYISGATLKVDAGQSLYHSMWEIPSA